MRTPTPSPTPPPRVPDAGAPRTTAVRVSLCGWASTTHYRTCPLCEATCGLAITVEDGRVTGTRGDADDVFSQGYICPKGTTLGALHEDPDRLRVPHLKQGDTHVPVSWDEAFARCAEGVAGIREKHGNAAFGIYLGNPNVHNLGGGLYAGPLIKALGSKAVFSASTVDQMPRHVSCGLMYGSPDAIPVPDLDRTHYLLMLGANPFESNGSLCTAPDWPRRLRGIQERDGKVVVVDPRRTRTAKAADEHLAIRPGTDTHFLLALAQVIVAEGWVAPGAAAEHTDGLDAIADAVAPFTPDAVSARTGIPADTIRRIARELHEAESAAVYGRMGAHTTTFGTLASWAADLVTFLLGHFDRPGGLLFPHAPHARPRRTGGGRGFRTGRWQSRVGGHDEIRGELPVAALAEEIETAGEGQIRGLLTIAGNPAISAPNAGGRLDRALGSLDFMISVDPYLNETTRHADVILPPPSALERGHYDLAFLGLAVRRVANYSPAIFDAEGPSEPDILAKLTLIAMGAGAEADPSVVHEQMVRGFIDGEVAKPHSRIHGRDAGEIQAALHGDTPEAQLVELLIRTGPDGDAFGAQPDGLTLETLEANPHGIDLGPLEPALPDALTTPSGRLELFPDAIARDLARLRADLGETAAPELVLVGRRTTRSCNSWMHNVDVLVRGRDRCTLQLHPDDAARLGVENGARVVVNSPGGKLEVPAEITDEVRVGVVSLPHGYGHDLPGVRASVAAKKPGVNSNWLTGHGGLDPLSGNAVLNGIPVEVAPAG